MSVFTIKRLHFFSVLLSLWLFSATATPAPAQTCDGALCQQQQSYNKEFPKSAQHDGAQSRMKDPTGACGQIEHMSLPTPDRTMRNFYMVTVPCESQSKQNCGGGKAGTQGWDSEHQKLAPLSTPDKAKNGNFVSFVADFMQFKQERTASPEKSAGPAAAKMQSQQQGASEAGATACQNATEQLMAILFSPTATINVANEASGTPGTTLTPFRPLSQAIWMVQRMFHAVYLPMAFLLLLPGALILQMKTVVLPGITSAHDEDTKAGPFAAILRVTIAVFLIPATQLIMSYCIDIGNSMTHEVAGHAKAGALLMWMKGTFMDGMQSASAVSQQQAGQIALKAVWNSLNMMLSYGLIILNAFQIALMCYLMLMGPIAAALYVWPGGVGRLFRPVFQNWVDAVVNLSMWKFWWCVIVLCMITRVNWLTELGSFIPNAEWEALMFTCFLVMMSYVPFIPFELKPGEMVDKLLQKAEEFSKAGKKGGSPA